MAHWSVTFTGKWHDGAYRVVACSFCDAVKRFTTCKEVEGWMRCLPYDGNDEGNLNGIDICPACVSRLREGAK